ncbi:MAG TPA: putative ABC transporter permease, partial [Erysipelotrichaceae bacterium]|nr:putative ABC transporter permease [Erysipelotrichaceae bacterium]
MDFYTLFIYFMIYSFLGWVIETIYCSLAEKRYVPRGFLNGPLTPIYGFGAIGLIFLLQDIKTVSLVFLSGVVATSFLEYVASYLLELIFDMHWWDYSGDKYNLNGRIKLKNSILFGIL